jgi:2-aminoadipate transaminase
LQPGGLMLELEHPLPVPCLGRHDQLARLAAEKPGLISFAGGLPDPSLFPKRALSEAFFVALEAHGRSALQYGWPEGSLELREEVARQLAARGARVEPERVMITSGAQQAILVAMWAAPQRRRIGVEPESYPGALDAFRAAKAELVALEEPADLYYVMPSISNPRGQPMATRVRHSLLARAKACGGYVLEDDAYDGTAFSGRTSRPLWADDPERVFHIGTFSKTLCPGLRLGWLLPPRRLARRALRRKQTQDLQTNSLSQAILVEYLKQGQFDSLKARARKHYARKAKLLQASVARHLPQFRHDAPAGGFSLWLESELECDDEHLLAAAIEHGVSFDPGRLFRTTARRGLAIRLCFSAVEAAAIDEGVARLRRALGRVVR